MREFSLCAFVRFETTISPSIWFDIILQNFKKPLDSFSPQIERKCSKEYTLNLTFLSCFTCVTITLQ